MADGKKSHRPSQIQKADTSMPSLKLSLRMKSSCTGDLAIKICGVLPNGTLRHHQVQIPGSTENRIYLVRKILNSRLFVSFTKFSLSLSLSLVFPRWFPGRHLGSQMRRPRVSQFLLLERDTETDRYRATIQALHACHGVVWQWDRYAWWF